MKKTLILLIAIIAIIIATIAVKNVVSQKEVQKKDVDTTEVVVDETVDMEAACNSALVYMSFMSGEDVDAFIAACLNGEHPDVIARYKAQMNGEDTSNIGIPPFAEPLIVVASPLENDSVASPIAVSGVARGYWFFEADAPVDVYNEAATIIGQGFITATESWMTEEFVPFEGTITFEDKLVVSGEPLTIIFNRANPSGIPDNTESISVNVIVE